MKRNYVIYLFLVTLLGLTACQSMSGLKTNSPMAADKLAIKSALEQYEMAVNSGNTQDLLALYEADAVQVAPNEPVIKGAEAIRSRAEANHAVYTYDLSSAIEDIQVSDNIATLRTQYSEIIVSKDNVANKITTKGSWLLLFHRASNGSWKIYLETWNHESPVAI